MLYCRRSQKSIYTITLVSHLQGRKEGGKKLEEDSCTQHMALIKVWPNQEGVLYSPYPVGKCLYLMIMNLLIFITDLCIYWLRSLGVSITMGMQGDPKMQQLEPLVKDCPHSRSEGILPLPSHVCVTFCISL